MINIFFSFFLFLFLSYNNILLFNEESLILLCFITFIGLIYNKFGKNFQQWLTQQTLDIQFVLRKSLINKKKILIKLILLSKKINILLYKFSFITLYYKKLIFLLSNLLINYKEQQKVLVYQKRFLLIKKVEQYTIKLLLLIIIKKLVKIIKIKQFFTIIFKTHYFLCINNISLRENICVIKKSKL